MPAAGDRPHGADLPDRVLRRHLAASNAIMIRAAITTFGGVETGSAYQAGLAFKHETAAAQAQDAAALAGEGDGAPSDGRTLVDSRRARRRPAGRSPASRRSRRCSRIRPTGAPITSLR